MRLAAANFLFLCLIAWACGQQEKQGIQGIKEIKTKQYAVAGQELYVQHCANCHQKDGTGLAQLIPPLKDVGYTAADAPKIARAIRYGVRGEIVVNGITYNQPMPSFPQLRPLDIAKITTYVISRWGEQPKLVTADEVGEYLK
jgi:cytochrome c551